MRETEMCVVVSYEHEEETKFDELGLNIRRHREMMNRTWGDEHETIEDRFRNPKDKFRLVFLCSKWLTGFDAPTVSTLYLDKPMRNHTLMQTIARANRVAPALDGAGNVAGEHSRERHGKMMGLVVDYIGVFKRLERALSKYARQKDNKTAYAAEDFDDLLGYLDAAIDEGDGFLKSQDIAIWEIIDNPEVFKNLSQFSLYADALSKTEELKKEFSVYQTAITSFYEACKPDILTEESLSESPYRGRYKRIKEAFEYLRKIIDRKVEDESKVEKARDEAGVLIDESIVSAGYTIASLKEIDLSQIDLEKLEQRFKDSRYKHLSIKDMVEFLRERLQQLVKRNVTRTDLSAKLQEIIANYNTASSDVEAFFRALRRTPMRRTQARHN